MFDGISVGIIGPNQHIVDHPLMFLFSRASWVALVLPVVIDPAWRITSVAGPQRCHAMATALIVMVSVCVVCAWMFVCLCACVVSNSNLNQPRVVYIWKLGHYDYLIWWGNGMLNVRCHTITLTNADILFIGPMEANVSEILSEIW